MLRGGCIAFLVLSFAFIAFWTWARDDLFPMQLTQSAPLQGPNRAAAVVQFDLQNDGYHIIGVNARGKWRRWTAVVTQSEFPDQKWQLLWSRDGSLVALKQSAELWGDSRIKTALYTSALDFRKNKSHESFDSWEEKPNSPFSRRIENLMIERGGTVAGRETKRDVGVWRWEDAQWKQCSGSSFAEENERIRGLAPQKS